MTLSDAQLGDWVTIEGLGSERRLRRRLLDLGFVPGTPVRVLRRAPLGDPLELELRGGRVSLRKADAATVAVSS